MSDLLNPFTLYIRHSKSKYNKKKQKCRAAEAETPRGIKKKTKTQLCCVSGGACGLVIFSLGDLRCNCFTSTRDGIGLDSTAQPGPSSQQRKSKLISVYLPSSSCTGYFVSYYPKVRRHGELEERGVISQRSSLVLRLSFWCIHDMVAKTKQELHGGDLELCGILGVWKTCPPGPLLLTHCYF